jgi:hypothetical protein
MKQGRTLLLKFPLVSLLACALAFSGLATAAAASRKVDDAAALRVAEVKLAALAKYPSAPPQVEPPKKAGKKHPHPARKKRVKRGGDPAPAGGVAPTAKSMSRHMSYGEVLNILATTRDFSGADLSGMNLEGQDLNGAKLNRANLHAANLERADLSESDLELTDLTGANLRGASMNQARLRGVRLDGAHLDGALWIDKTVCRKGSVGSCVE